MSKVYDCCTFLNENGLYELRLNQHWDYVDKFVVLEAGETHTGIKKPFRFDKKRFEKYSEKLIYRTFDSLEEEMSKNPHLLDEYTTHDRTMARQNTDDWARSDFQGNYLFKILLEEGVQDSDVVIISGVDEIIKEDAFEQALSRFEDKDIKYQMLSGPDKAIIKDGKVFNSRPSFGFEMDTYVYKFNFFNQLLCVSLMTEAGVLKEILPSTIRGLGMSTHPPIKDGGWHFTFFDDTDGEKVLEKQRSWAHSKDRIPGQKTKFEHSTKAEALQRLFMDYQIKKVDILESTHPKYLLDNLEKYKNYID